jgi:outer membrane protein OmpA-like peptidoglycan-associated protein/uncharacterized protein YidB (DUF937 family)
LESLTAETAQKFGLGNNANALTKATLSYLFDETHGGMAGFLQRFRDAGAGPAVESWISRGENQPVSEAQVADALAGEPLTRISESAGLSEAKAAGALSHLLPRLIDFLTPEGLLPVLPPAAVSALIGKPREMSFAPAEFDAQGVDQTKRNSWFVPAMLLSVIVLIVLILANVKGTPKGGAKVTVRNNGDIVEYYGLVGDTTTQETVAKSVAEVFGGQDRVQGSVGLDDTVARPDWLGKFHEILALFKIPGSEVDFDGNTVRIAGFFTESEKAQLLEKLKALLPGMNVQVGGDKVAETVKAAYDRSLAALTALPNGFTATQLVTALNLSIINFANGSAEIPAEAAPLILKASDSLKSAPAGTRIEIGGHTDANGDPVANQKLSEARAAAVKRALEAKGVPAAMLVVKGYGSAQPRAGNDTEYGRFQNRRIEYKAI